MSLLLDALKKAAQEKLEKQRQNGQLKPESPSREAHLSAEQKGAPAEAPPGAGYSPDLPVGRRTAEVEEPDALELMPLEDDELHIDTEAFSEPTETDYEYRRSQVLASELKAFNGDTDSQGEITGGHKDPDTGSWSTEPPPAVYSNTPRQAAQVFLSKTPDRSGRKRLLLLTGLGVPAVLLVAGLYAYNYLPGTGENPPVLKSDPRSASLPARISPSTTDVEVDPTLLIEQEDYDKLLTSDLGETERQSAGAMPEDVRRQGKQEASQSPAAVAGTARETPVPRKAATDKVKLNISRTRDKEPLQDILMRGYTAYNKAEFENAEVAYRQALTRAPDSRDAMLGMAAVRYAQGDTSTAVSYYRKLLQRDPRDELALAALAGIEENAAEPALPQTDLADESRIKLLLAEKPDSGYLHFTLGNIYAGGRRWAEAQKAYFDAYRLEPDNPDYAFNLAVSLDHLGKPREAARYYRQSLILARERKPNFNTQSAVSRLDSLQEF